MEKKKSVKKSQTKKSPQTKAKKAPVKNTTAKKTAEEITSRVPNRVVHFDIPVDNIERAIKFYSTNFGWKFIATGMEGDYHLATTVPTDEKGAPIESRGINGGIGLRQNPKQSISIAIGVPDIDKSLRTIEKNGGKILYPKMPIGDMGYVAQFEDPDGNIISLWEDIKK